MPFKINTASSAIKPGRCSVCQSDGLVYPLMRLLVGLLVGLLVRPLWGVLGAAACGCTAPGWGARVQAHRPTTNAAINTAVLTGNPATTGSTDASSTPAKPSPSRHATMRLRTNASPPKRAPQLWWATLIKL